MINTESIKKAMGRLLDNYFLKKHSREIFLEISNSNLFNGKDKKYEFTK